MSDEENNIQIVFDAAVAEYGTSDKNSVLMSLINEGGLDVTTAIREYNRLARESGLTMTKEQKETKIAEILGEQSFDTRDDLEAAKNELMDALDVAPTTAMNYIKAYAEDKDIELPITQRKAMASKADVVAFIIEHKDEKKAELSKGLQEEFGYAKGTADTVISHLAYMQEYAAQVA